MKRQNMRRIIRKQRKEQEKKDKKQKTEAVWETLKDMMVYQNEDDNKNNIDLKEEEKEEEVDNKPKKGEKDKDEKDKESSSIRKKIFIWGFLGAGTLATIFGSNHYKKYLQPVKVMEDEEKLKKLEEKMKINEEEQTPSEVCKVLEEMEEELTPEFLRTKQQEFYQSVRQKVATAYGTDISSISVQSTEEGDFFLRVQLGNLKIDYLPYNSLEAAGNIMIDKAEPMPASMYDILNYAKELGEFANTQEAAKAQGEKGLTIKKCKEAIRKINEKEIAYQDTSYILENGKNLIEEEKEIQEEELKTEKETNQEEPER